MRKVLDKRYFLLFIPLFIFWIILSPEISLQEIFMGVIVSLVIVVLNSNFVFKEDETSLYEMKNIKFFAIFLTKMLLEIIKANIDVAKIVLNPSLPISPVFIKVPVVFKKDFNKAIFANAVTLTPGTLSVDILEDGIVIHALTKAAAKSMYNSMMEQYIKKMEEI